MSTENIIDMTPDAAGGVTVTFSCHRGGNRSYHYSMPDSLAIMGGADPAEYTPDEGGGVGGDVATIFSDVEEAAGEIATDIGEIGAAL